MRSRLGGYFLSLAALLAAALALFGMIAAFAPALPRVSPARGVATRTPAPAPSATREPPAALIASTSWLGSPFPPALIFASAPPEAPATLPGLVLRRRPPPTRDEARAIASRLGFAAEAFTPGMGPWTPGAPIVFLDGARQLRFDGNDLVYVANAAHGPQPAQPASFEAGRAVAEAWLRGLGVLDGPFSASPGQDAGEVDLRSMWNAIDLEQSLLAWRGATVAVDEAGRVSSARIRRATLETGTSVALRAATETAGAFSDQAGEAARSRPLLSDQAAPRLDDHWSPQFREGDDAFVFGALDVLTPVDGGPGRVLAGGLPVQAEPPVQRALADAVATGAGPWLVHGRVASGTLALLAVEASPVPADYASRQEPLVGGVAIDAASRTAVLSTIAGSEFVLLGIPETASSDARWYVDGWITGAQIAGRRVVAWAGATALSYPPGAAVPTPLSTRDVQQVRARATQAASQPGIPAPQATRTPSPPAAATATPGSAGPARVDDVLGRVNGVIFETTDGSRRAIVLSLTRNVAGDSDQPQTYSLLGDGALGLEMLDGLRAHVTGRVGTDANGLPSIQVERWANADPDARVERWLGRFISATVEGQPMLVFQTRDGQRFVHDEYRYLAPQAVEQFATDPSFASQMMVEGLATSERVGGLPVLIVLLQDNSPAAQRATDVQALDGVAPRPRPFVQRIDPPTVRIIQRAELVYAAAGGVSDALRLAPFWRFSGVEQADGGPFDMLVPAAAAGRD